jgi:hypothetical protein
VTRCHEELLDHQDAVRLGVQSDVADGVPSNPGDEDDLVAERFEHVPAIPSRQVAEHALCEPKEWA